VDRLGVAAGTKKTRAGTFGPALARRLIHVMHCRLEEAGSRRARRIVVYGSGGVFWGQKTETERHVLQLFHLHLCALRDVHYVQGLVLMCRRV
jgi:hypothetical protein